MLRLNFTEGRPGCPLVAYSLYPLDSPLNRPEENRGKRNLRCLRRPSINGEGGYYSNGT